MAALSVKLVPALAGPHSLNGALVDLVGASKQTATTTATGECRFVDVADGNYELRVRVAPAFYGPGEAVSVEVPPRRIGDEVVGVPVQSAPQRSKVRMQVIKYFASDREVEGRNVGMLWTQNAVSVHSILRTFNRERLRGRFSESDAIIFSSWQPAASPRCGIATIDAGRQGAL